MAQITLDSIEAEDLITLQCWRNSANVMPYCRQHRLLTLDDMEEWYETGDRDNLFLIRCDGKPIGVGGLVRVDWRNRKGEVSFYVAEKCNNDDIKTALNMVLYYGFATLQMWKIYFPVYAFNPRLGLYKEVMIHEYTAQKEYYYEGKYYDREVLVAYNEQL